MQYTRSSGQPPLSAARGLSERSTVDSVLLPEARSAVEGFLRSWEHAPRRTRERLRSKVPIGEMKLAAIEHENPWVRRSCLSFLDHHAADESAGVFLQALDDPVAPVRDLALHGLACEQCRADDLCVTEVTPRIARVLEDDPNPEVRFKAIPILRRLATRDGSARSAIERAAEHDADERVREAATAVLRGERPRRWNQFRRKLTSRKAKASGLRIAPAADPGRSAGRTSDE